MKILVTGCAGFIGSQLTARLIKEKHSVIGIDNFDPFYDRKIKEGNLTPLKKSEGFEFHEFNLEDEHKLRRIFDTHRFDVIVHLAAKAGVRPSLKDPLAYVDANVKATVNILNEMQKSGNTKMVFASSSSIYGKSKEIPFKESTTFDKSISVYATSKQSCELYNQMFFNLYNLSIINLRFFTVYGPGQRPDLAIHKFLKANLKGDTINVFGDGSMARDYTFVEDTVSGIKGAIERISTSSRPVYETYNLGNSTPISLKQLLSTIEKVTGKKNVIKNLPIPLGDVPITFADIENSKKYLGYNPQTKLEDGLKVMNEWIKSIY